MGEGKCVDMGDMNGGGEQEGISYSHYKENKLH